MTRKEIKKFEERLAKQRSSITPEMRMQSRRKFVWDKKAVEHLMKK